MTNLLEKVLGYGTDVEDDMLLKIPKHGRSGKNSTIDEDFVLKMPKLEEPYDCSASETASSSPLAFTGALGAVQKEEEYEDIAPEGKQYIEVTCGELVGYMHMNLFICPGIRVPCIETVEEPGKLLTPVEYTIKAGKDKQKDWKGSIKCQGKVLRTLMDNKQLDFFNHDTRCSAKCHSRNYMSAKCEKPPVVKVKVHKTPKPYDRPPTPTKKEMQEQLLQNPRVQACFAKFMEDQRQKAVKKNASMIQNFIVHRPVVFCESSVNEGQMHRVTSAICQKVTQLSQELLLKGPNFNENATRLCQAMQVLGMDGAMAKELASAHVQLVGVSPQKSQDSKMISDSPPSVFASSSDSASLEAINSLQNLQNPSYPGICNNNNISTAAILEKLAQQLQVDRQ